MQLQLSGTGNYHLELAITIMHRVNQGRTQKLIHRSGLNLPLPSKTGQEHQTPYRTTKTHINPATSMQQQLQLSGTGNNHLDLAKKIKWHLNQSRARNIDPQVRPEPTAAV